MSQILERLMLKPKTYKVQVHIRNDHGQPIYKIEVLAMGRTKWHAMRIAEKSLSLKAHRAWKVKKDKKK